MLDKEPNPAIGDGTPGAGAGSAIRVAIVSGSEQRGRRLSDLLRGAGLSAIQHDPGADGLLHGLDPQAIDVLLVDLSEHSEAQTTIIDSLLEYDDLPVLYHDSSAAGTGTDALWAKKLARKLTAIARLATERQAQPPEAAAATVDPAPHTDRVTPPGHEPEAGPEGAATNVWVLGASLGGPQAVRQFLAAVEPGLPVTFVLAQHIGANHIALLAEQLNRITGFKVLTAGNGHLLRHHQVLLAPADQRLSITDDGRVALTPAPADAMYSPSIDDTITAVAERYGANAGAIVFSGMGDDGARGCEVMARCRGIVWAQDVASCVISSMPDQARRTGTVTFSAEPQALARRLHDYLQHELTALSR